MRALDRATSLLGAGRDVSCEVRTLVDSATEPFRTDGNFAREGPRCDLPRDACVPLSLALHELCTNAAKHGALTRPEGKVELSWHCDPAGLLTLDWRERDGPPVPAERRAGMGTQLLRGGRSRAELVHHDGCRQRPKANAAKHRKIDLSRALLPPMLQVPNLGGYLWERSPELRGTTTLPEETPEIRSSDEPAMT